MKFLKIFGRSKEVDFNDVAKLIDELTNLKKERKDLLRNLLREAKRLDSLENLKDEEITRFNEVKNALAKNLNNELELIKNYRELFLKVKKNIPLLEPRTFSDPELKNFINLLNNVSNSIKLFTDKTFERGGLGVQDQYISLIRDLTQEDERWVKEGFYKRLKTIFRHNSQRVEESNILHGKIRYDGDVLGDIKKQLKNMDNNKEKIKDELEGLDENHKRKIAERLIFIHFAGVGIVATSSQIFLGENYMFLNHFFPFLGFILYLHEDYYNFKIPDRLEQLMKLSEDTSNFFGESKS